jgi:hypothetical protein
MGDSSAPVLRLVPDALVVEVDELETDDPAAQGEMTITIALTDADGGTEVHAMQEGYRPACRRPTTSSAGGQG